MSERFPPGFENPVMADGGNAWNGPTYFCTDTRDSSIARNRSLCATLKASLPVLERHLRAVTLLLADDEELEMTSLEEIGEHEEDTALELLSNRNRLERAIEVASHRISDLELEAQQIEESSVFNPIIKIATALEVLTPADELGDAFLQSALLSALESQALAMRSDDVTFAAGELFGVFFLGPKYNHPSDGVPFTVARLRTTELRSSVASRLGDVANEYEGVYPSLVLSILQRLSGGLAALELLGGQSHRAIHTDNLFYRQAGKVLVMVDGQPPEGLFPLLREIRLKRRSAPSWMAPEVRELATSFDCHTLAQLNWVSADVFSLGVLCIDLLLIDDIRGDPFADCLMDRRSRAEMILRCSAQREAVLLMQLIERCLDRTPENRPRLLEICRHQDAEELILRVARRHMDAAQSAVEGWWDFAMGCCYRSSS